MDKKRNFIALLLAITTMVSLTVTSFAEGNDINENEIQEFSLENESKIVLGDDEVNEVATGDLLAANSVYTFPIYLVDGEDKLKLSEEDLNEMNIVIEKVSSAGGIKSVKLSELGGIYSIRVNTQTHPNTYTAKSEYSIKLQSKKSDKVYYETNVNFAVDCNKIEDSALSGTAIKVTNARPIITSDQFAKINSLAGGKAVQFSAGNWKFDVKTANQGNVNMTYNANVLKVVSEKFPENQFKFVNFPSSPSFPQDGVFTIDASDKADTFEDMFVYRYLDGVIYKINAKHDEEANTLSFPTKNLGTFFVTDKELDDKAVLGSSVIAGSDKTDDGKGNPSTGAGSVAGALAIAGVSGLALAISKKEKSSK